MQKLKGKQPAAEVTNNDQTKCLQYDHGPILSNNYPVTALLTVQLQDDIQITS
ncbi:hypothetical protein C0995_000453, partial [Termitomyces sp. Mi166